MLPLVFQSNNLASYVCSITSEVESLRSCTDGFLHVTFFFCFVFVVVVVLTLIVWDTYPNV